MKSRVVQYNSWYKGLNRQEESQIEEGEELGDGRTEGSRATEDGGQAAISLHGRSAGKESTCSAGDPSSIPGLGRPPGEGNGSSLQYSCLENPTDRGAWQTPVHGITQSRTGLNDFHFHFLTLMTQVLVPCWKQRHVRVLVRCSYIGDLL